MLPLSAHIRAADSLFSRLLQIRNPVDLEKRVAELRDRADRVIS